jgi:heptosyltransferase-2
VNLLVVAPNWIGDALLAQPLLERLRRCRPDAHIDVLAPAWTAPVFRRMPEVREVIEAPFAHGELALGRQRAIARTLRSRGYDEAIVLPNSLKSALVPWLAGIPKRVGYRGEHRYGLLNAMHRLDPARVPLMADRYARLADPPGRPIGMPLGAGHLTVDASNRARVVAALGLDVSRPIVAFCPGAEYGPAKRWPARHFAALAEMLAREGRAVWLFGSPKDAPVAAEIRALAPDVPIVDLCGRTDLAAAIDLLALAEAVVTNDSGLMHVAAGVARPVVALYGSSSPAHTPPLTQAARLVSLNVECSPCFQRECPLGHFKCMNDLSPERVLGELRALVPKQGST